MAQVDLFLGSDLGKWVAEIVDIANVGCVTTTDAEIAAIAQDRSLAVGGQRATRALSVHYPRILSAAELGQYDVIYNLHPGLLPWGRGHFPLVWAIWNREPAGATLHRMVPRVDAGPIVDQIPVAVREDDTGGSLFLRIREAERLLLARWWPRIVAGNLSEHPQGPGGSYHDKAVFEALLRTDPATVPLADRDRLRRALTFPGKPGLSD